MHSEPSEIVSMDLSLMGLILFVGLGLALILPLAMVLRSFTGRACRDNVSPLATTGRSRTGIAIVLFPALAILGLLLAVTMLYAVRFSSSDHTNVVVTDSSSSHFTEATSSAVMTPPAPVESPHGAAEDQPIDTESAASTAVPDWTQSAETVIADGQVPHILFVEKSGLYSTESEAMAEAMKNAMQKFRARLAEDWTRLAVQPLPENIFREVSLQQTFTEQRMHRFGSYEEPMYRVYLQYEDSARAREPVIEAWKNSFSGNLALRYGIGFGVVTALLGVVSAGLRAVTSTRGSRNRAVMTAIAFVGTALAGLLFVG